MNALGLVETIGYVAAIEALDVCLKSASVEVVGIQKVGQGIVTIEVSGDVGAVKSAVEAAKYAAEKVGVLRATHVIPRLHADVHDALFKKEDISLYDVKQYTCKRYKKSKFWQFTLYTNNKKNLINTRYKEEFEEILKQNKIKNI